ncbi:MAG: sigma 54-interacting transcriptional regulator [Myxococcota bacterium]
MHPTLSDSDATELETSHGQRRRLRPPRPGIVSIYAEGIEPLGATPLLEPAVLGRTGGGAPIQVDDQKVSRQHVMLAPRLEGFEICDLESRNGTFYAGTPLSGTRTLPFGSIVHIGRQLILLTDDVDVHARRHLPSTARLRGGPALEIVRQQIRRLAPSSIPILVVGESGTGKELVAGAIHEASARSGPIVRVNAAAIPAELVESELFGHVKGAFSGADGIREGLFRQADRGTLVLDEVGELPPGLQAKLLRVLEDGRVRPVGSDASFAVDVRVVASTNRDLEQAVRHGSFRLDLLHRLQGAVLEVPPLSARRDDIPLLAEGFAEEEAVIVSTWAADALTRGTWPGNVRQLRNVVRRAAAAAKAEGRSRILESDLSVPQTGAGLRGDGLSSSPTESEQVRLTTALELCQGNVSRVSRELGIARSQLYVLLQRYNIDPAAFR